MEMIDAVHIGIDQHRVLVVIEHLAVIGVVANLHLVVVLGEGVNVIIFLYYLLFDLIMLLYSACHLALYELIPMSFQFLLIFSFFDRMIVMFNS